MLLILLLLLLLASICPPAAGLAFMLYYVFVGSNSPEICFGLGLKIVAQMMQYKKQLAMQFTGSRGLFIDTQPTNTESVGRSLPFHRISLFTSVDLKHYIRFAGAVSF